jgi:hypothetical protein
MQQAACNSLHSESAPALAVRDSNIHARACTQSKRLYAPKSVFTYHCFYQPNAPPSISILSLTWPRVLDHTLSTFLFSLDIEIFVALFLHCVFLSLLV